MPGPAPHQSPSLDGAATIRSAALRTSLNEQVSVLVPEAIVQRQQITDDELAQINGDREQLEGIIQARYGYAKDQVRQEVDEWLRRQ